MDIRHRNFYVVALIGVVVLFNASLLLTLSGSNRVRADDTIPATAAQPAPDLIPTPVAQTEPIAETPVPNSDPAET
ncbi:MAG: hypothetical protein K8I30_12010, partial [Anaerolineae bacterium]|nr:hypothetical protein [Anaerolineae bacterium]